MSRRVFFSRLQEDIQAASRRGEHFSLDSVLGLEHLQEFFSDERHQQRRRSLFEKRARERGSSFVAGVDEAGRGPLAGPVVAAAVVFGEIPFLPCVNDSKLLTGRERELLCHCIKSTCSAYAVGMVQPEEIDRINIHNASLQAMRRALMNLSISPGYVLIDGLFTISGLSMPQQAVVKGDRLSFVIACASIIAKVTRDRIMCEYDLQYPGYGFASHKGYSTRTHVEALRRLGCSPIHRKSYAPVKECMRPVYEQGVLLRG